MVSRRLCLGVLAFALGCREPLDDNLSRIEGPRVLAVRASPAEAAPGEEVEYEILYVDENGDLDASSLGWGFCLARKPLDELGPVHEACLTGGDTVNIVPIGAGPSVSAALPDDGCRLFGPDRPPPVEGQPAGRPVDPDSTGGYYQPLRISSTPVTIAATRIACGLAGARPEVMTEFAKRYRRNENPAVLRAWAEQTEQTPKDRIVVETSTEVTLAVEWEDCGGADEPCTGSEPYVYFDPESRSIVDRREAIRISWATTRGSFAFDHTGRSEEEAESARSENTWSSPSEAGDATVYIVIRDDRGGVGWRRFHFDVVEP
ncbi:MAG: hypothetical protein HOW73_14695 [Polyangiaceae bacterium]|nr:hypothetical protein [Polyangiaceae bacterium]